LSGPSPAAQPLVPAARETIMPPHEYPAPSNVRSDLTMSTVSLCVGAYKTPGYCWLTYFNVR